MKIVQINSTCGKGSTGKICLAISQLLNEKQIENYILYSHGASDYPNGIRFGNEIYYKLQALKGRVFGNNGFNSHLSTWQLIAEMKKIGPDIVHLHNIHSNDVNLELLFRYLKGNHIKVFWTFHDCWAFTGYCPHFTLAKCDRYKQQCGDCPNRKASSWFFDRSGELQKRKYRAVQGADLTVITPSKWLADCVKESLWKDYPVKVINNGIDLSVFHPTDSDFRQRHGIAPNQKMLLGVAFGWGVHKGLDVFVELSKRLDQKQYRIVLVGTDDAVDKQLPRNIISIHRTQNQQELAEIYSAADLFVNPTKEEVFGLVNVEALACGTSGITFNSGGSPECYESDCGAVVECDDIDALARGISYICEHKPFEKENCIQMANKFDLCKKYKDYLSLYNQ